jgi:hypothetical protein
MRRKPGRLWGRFGVAVTSWVVAALLAQAAMGADIGLAGRRLEERIKLQLQLKGGGGTPEPPPKQPERSHEDAIEPWELVPV